ncbi:MAG: glycosyltransferase family 4 protein [Gammaproteobacteria bacterium]|nr:glycosyltransferase family 4 protein [Gammaproteobacteria bacterium]
MKLGFLIYSYFPYGGQQRDFLKIAKECIARGHQVIVYTMKWEGQKQHGLELRIVPVASRLRLRRYRLFTEWVLGQLQEDPCDLIVGFNKMPGLNLYFAADPCFEEKAQTQRGGYYRYTPRYRHFKDYEQAVFGTGSSTRILTLSPLQQQDYEKHYSGCSNRLFPLPPGVDPDRKYTDTDSASMMRRQLREELSLDDSDLLVLQVGSGFKVKGVDRSLHAIASLPVGIRKRITYLLIGQDKPGRFLRLARGLGVSDQFQVMPGRNDIPRFLLGADLLLHPAYSESAGYVLLEATIAGLPVLTTGTCGYAHYIKKAGSGLVCSEPFVQQELNENLLHMLTSSDRATWQLNGIEFGRHEDLYSMAGAAADHIEQIGHTAYR